jgi:hypothetical protein
MTTGWPASLVTCWTRNVGSLTSGINKTIGLRPLWSQWPDRHAARRTRRLLCGYSASTPAKSRGGGATARLSGDWQNWRIALARWRWRIKPKRAALEWPWTAVITLSGRYDQILNYVVATDFVFFGLTATCVFAFRRREQAAGQDKRVSFRTPGHPITTITFVLACWVVVANTIYKYPANSLIGTLILLLGVPVYLLWSRHNKLRTTA